MNEYIDVRGIYPIYFIGSFFYRLPIEARGWTVREALMYMISEAI